MVRFGRHRATPSSSRRAVDPIRHVVVLMFENRSFDQMLGCMPGVDGIDIAAPGINLDSGGYPYSQRPSSDMIVDPDPKHEHENVVRQLAGNNAGFVRDYEQSYPTTSFHRQQIMDYFPEGDLPVLHELAKRFTVCDRWYSSVPGPTWTNRLFLHSGTSKGLVRMRKSDLLYYDQDTIFDRLNDKGIRWRVYYGDVPQSWVLVHQRRWPNNAARYRKMREFHQATQRPEREFPAYTFIEPRYLFGDQNDDHPPHSTMAAQRLLAEVYNAIRSNEPLWNSTLLVVLYDEHGGFYDHAAPPGATAPDKFNEEYAFDQLGVRVPAVLISPWMGARVVSETFDHTSVLKYLTDKWDLDPLGDRAKNANSIESALLESARRSDDLPGTISVPELMMQSFGDDFPREEVPEEGIPPNDLQQSLIALTEYIEENELEPQLQAMSMAAGAVSEEKQAKTRVELFLEQQQRKASTRRM